MQWISVKDRLPPLEHEVLAFDGEMIRVAHLEPQSILGAYMTGAFWTYYDYLEWYDVSHWMELPKLPEE